jgi:hypothetical protein
MSTDRSAPNPNRDRRFVGVLVATFICAVITICGAAVTTGGWVVGAVGWPAAIGLAWRFAPEAAVAPGTRPLAVALWYEARVILATDALIMIAWALIMVLSGPSWVFTDHGPLEWPVYAAGGVVLLAALAFAGYLLGLAVVGLPALVLVLPAAVLWAVILKVIVGRLTARMATNRVSAA